MIYTMILRNKMINPITSNKENDHTINVSAQAVDPTVEPEKNNVASQNNSTKFNQ